MYYVDHRVFSRINETKQEFRLVKKEKEKNNKTTRLKTHYIHVCVHDDDVYNIHVLLVLKMIMCFFFFFNNRPMIIMCFFYNNCPNINNMTYKLSANTTLCIPI